MSQLSENQLVELVVGWVKQYRRPGEQAHTNITAETDLILSGLLDSFGFVDLIMYIETQGECRVDLTDADPGEFSVVRGLCRIALKNHP